MAGEVWAAAGDVGLDTANLAYQQQDNNRPQASLLRTALPGLTVWGAWGLSEKLKQDKFAGAHQPVLRQMRAGANTGARRTIAESYFERNAEKIQRMSGISRAAQFSSKAETAYLRQAASVGLRRFATALNVGFFIAPALYGVTMHGFKGIKKLGYELETPHFGGHFVSNASQATERQRAMQALHNSEFNGRTALGNEAQLYHA